GEWHVHPAGARAARRLDRGRVHGRDEPRAGPRRAGGAGALPHRGLRDARPDRGRGAARAARGRARGRRDGLAARPRPRGARAHRRARARRGRRVVRLKGGDPFVFGRGGEEALALARAGVPFEVVPGVTAAVAVPAYAGIPLTHRGVAASFAVVTGHEEACKREASVDWARLARAADTLVVLMGVGALPRITRELIAHGRPPATPVA